MAVISVDDDGFTDRDSDSGVDNDKKGMQVSAIGGRGAMSIKN